MEQAIRTPSEIHSFNLDESIFDLNKKRKLQADQFSLPISKHKCWNHRVSPKPVDVSKENRQIEDLTAHLANNETEKPSIYYVSEPVESAKDSNSFIGDEDDCSMSESGDSKFESNGLEIWSSTATSALADLSCNNVNDYQTSDVTTDGVSAENEPVYEVEDYDPTNYFDEIQVYQNLAAGNVEVNGIGRLESFKILNKTLNSCKANNPGNILLSTGSCSVNQDAESVRKPTIDQEFEEYFSMLML